MLDNAAEETYIMVDVVVNGTTFTNVGIRPKGNSSLRDVASSDSDRYSFRLKFDEYVDTMISEYVENDVSVFCTFEEYKLAVSSFKTLGNLRAESIQGQLDGTVPSTTMDQSTNSEQLISAGDLNLADLSSSTGGK